MTLLERLPASSPQDVQTTVLKTERLVLRALHADDAQAIAALIDDLRIAAMLLRVPHPYTRKDAENFIARTSTSTAETPFAITLAGDRLIGVGGLHRLDQEPEIGYWIGIPHWGRGYASETARALVEYAFDALDREFLVAGARISNPASRRVLEKCGFQWTGVKLGRVLALKASVPCDRFRLDRERRATLRSATAAGEAIGKRRFPAPVCEDTITPPR
jgi:RimJ/RimL family protein N-acetyltransferase